MRARKIDIFEWFGKTVYLLSTQLSASLEFPRFLTRIRACPKILPKVWRSEKLLTMVLAIESLESLEFSTLTQFDGGRSILKNSSRTDFKDSSGAHSALKIFSMNDFKDFDGRAQCIRSFSRTDCQGSFGERKGTFESRRGHDCNGCFYNT